MQRIEKKFILDKQEFLKTSKELKLKSTFPPRIVKSIYFDTHDLKYFYDSEEGITPRIKVRRRGYNAKPLTNLEIKKSNNYNREKNTFIMNVMIGCMVGIQSLFTILESYSTDSNQEEISNTTKVNFSQLLEKTNKFH